AYPSRCSGSCRPARFSSWRNSGRSIPPVPTATLRAMSKPVRPQARALGDLVRETLRDTFARRGFASTELVTRWPGIASAEIAAHAEPIRMQWPRGEPDTPEPATLVLRVEGPTAVEIQHLAPVILERVNRFFGWRAVGRIALRQAPLSRRGARPAPPVPDH